MEPSDSLVDGESFAQILERSVEDGLFSVLGRSGVEMVSALCPIPVLATDPRKLHDLLESIFMAEAAVIIEKEIAKTLLDNIGDERPARRGAQKRARSPATGSGGKRLDSVPEDYRKVIQHFAALDALPRGHAGLQGALSVTVRGRGARSSIDSTAVRFADAFKKGKVSGD